MHDDPEEDEPSPGSENPWQSVDPGGNGWLIFACVHPGSGHLFFSSDMGSSLYRSTDRGETWEPIANPVTGTPSYIAGDPGEAATLYMSQVGASPRSSGIWKSSDNGNTWQHLFQSEAFGKSSSQSGLVDPFRPQVLYWTMADRGVWRSTDGGISWNDISHGLPRERLEYCEIHSHGLELDHNTPPAARTLYYPTNLGLYRFREVEGTWELAGGLPVGVCTQVIACDRGVLYAAFPGQGLYKSEDGGQTWQQLTNGLRGFAPLHIAATKSQPQVLYVATTRDRGVYRSVDGGGSFHLITQRRFTQGHNWPMNYRQHEAVSGMFMLIDPHDPLTVYLDYNKKTHDGGRTWQHYGTKHVGNDRWTGTGLSLLTEYRAVFDPHQPGRVWLGFSDTGLMLTEDGGVSIVNVYSSHRSEVNHVAHLRDQLVFSSSSCVSIAVDPDLTTTIYASINGKNADCRAAIGGALIKSVNGGQNWFPIHEKHGLADGIIRDIVIAPDSPLDERTVYVASYGNGVYQSNDDGRSFNRVTPAELFAGNTRLMCLKIAPSDPNTLYLGVGGSEGIRPLSAGQQGYPALAAGQYGGVYKTSDRGVTWQKQNSRRELPSIVDLAVHPTDPQTVYAAAWEERFLVPGDSPHPEWREGGIFKTTDGGNTWNKVFSPPNDELKGCGSVEGICLNPLAPEIIYTAVRHHGVFRSFDGGKTWAQVGQGSMDRRQKRFHSICLDPHAPYTVWLAHFGASFSKGIDPEAKALLEQKYGQANLVRNPGFEELERSGSPLHWQVHQPPASSGRAPVFSISTERARSGKRCAHFHLSQAYIGLPTTIPAFREQQRLEQAGKVERDPSWQKVMAELGGQSTSTWLSQKLDPYFTSLMRGRDVLLEMDVYLLQRNLPGFWERWYDMCEVPRLPPQVYLTEVRDFNVHWPVAETSLEDLEEECSLSAEGMLGQWLHCQATGRVSEGARWTQVTITGIGPYAGVTDLYVDNVRLTLA